MKEADILYQNGAFWVTRYEFGSGKKRPKTLGYAVWKSGVTHSKLVAEIGYGGSLGFEKAQWEADRRAAVQ